MNHYNHWDLKEDTDHILWLGINRSDASINTINEEVLDELNRALDDISTRPNAKGLIIYSLKEKGFIAGADVHAFSQFETTDRIVDFLRKGQQTFARIEALAIPTLAMIDGFCMGGGFELALACDYRIASNEEGTRLGLPEILLGIHPGWGGTVRLPRLMGAFDALSKVILTGAAIPAERAKKWGMIDDAVPQRQLKRAAIFFINNKPPRHKPRILQSVTNCSWVRALLAPLIRHNVAKRVSKNHYPAPYAVIDLIEKETGKEERAYLKEIDSIERLVENNETAKNLIRVFSLRERMKGFAKNSHFKAERVHVVGAGVMGGDIAAWCALRGLRVTLQDQGFERIAPAIARAHAFFKKKLRKPRLIEAAMDRLIPDPQGHGIAKADVIIEAIFENLEAKQMLFKNIEASAKKEALLATNTSSIPLDEISQIMINPSRLIGIHFFNPVTKMELVEVVSSDVTDKTIEAQGFSFVNQIGRLPLPVRSSPGFLINRVLMPYLMECMILLNEGYGPEEIDASAKAFGMMMGPVEMADTVGLDVCLAVAENLTHYFGGEIPEKLREKVRAGKLGRKTGEGFYRYNRGKPVKRKLKDQESNDTIATRLILRIVHESEACLQEGVIADSDLLDGGMIFATGFAPFRGGPIYYAKHPVTS